MVNTVFLFFETLTAFRKNATRTIVTGTKYTVYTELYHKEGSFPGTALGRKTIKAVAKAKTCKERVTLDCHGSFLNRSLRPLTEGSPLGILIALRRKATANGAKE
jgi:hypothetical protein